MKLEGNKRWLWAAVIGMALVGLVLRILMFRDSALGDEMSTLWIIRGNDLFGVVSAVYSDAEISPPFFFLLAKVSSWIFGQTPEAIRIPSMIAGVLTIPLVYLVGLKMIGRRGAIYATAIATVSPFLVYFSANARAYAVMTLLLLLATWFLLEATSEKGSNWHWLGWAVASCLAVYSHYTAGLLVVGHLIWVLWFFPALRVRALIFSGLSFLLFAPWLAGFKADLDSPTSYILQQIQGSGFLAKRQAIEQLVFLRITITQPSFLSRPDTLIGSAGMLIALASIAVALIRGRIRRPGPERWRGAWLAVLMAGTVVAGELLLLALGTDIFGSRNLAPAWAAIPFLIAILCLMAGRIWGVLALALILVGYSFSTVHIIDPGNSTMSFNKIARDVGATEDRGGTLLDGAFLSPAPLSPLDGYLESDLPEFRLTNLQDRPDFIEGIYADYDPQAITNQAFDTDGPVRLLTVSEERTPVLNEDGTTTFMVDWRTVEVPPGWSIESQITRDGLKPLVLTTFVKDRKSAGGKP